MQEMNEPKALARFHLGMSKLKEELDKAKPDVIIAITNEHFVNFYLGNMPAICVATAESHLGPIEPPSWLQIPQGTVPGHPDVATALLRTGIESGFDMAFTEELALDHGTMVRLHFLTPDRDIPVVPIIINNLVEPMPLPRRIFQLGKLLAAVAASRPKEERIAILGTGGLSHWVGTPESGQVDMEFDERFLDGIDHAKGPTLADWTSAEIEKAGNGAHEVRNWIGVMGSVPGVRGEIIAHEELGGTGCAAVVWAP